MTVRRLIDGGVGIRELSTVDASASSRERRWPNPFAIFRAMAETIDYGVVIRDMRIEDC